MSTWRDGFTPAQLKSQLDFWKERLATYQRNLANEHYLIRAGIGGDRTKWLAHAESEVAKAKGEIADIKGAVAG